MKLISDTDLNDILVDIRELVDLQNDGALRNILIEMHPADIAFIITQLRKDRRKYLFNLLSTELAGDVLPELDPPVQTQVLEDVEADEISSYLDEMESDDAADLVSELPEEMQSQVLDSASDEVEKEVKELLAYEEDTAGGIMALEYVAVKAEDTVNDTIEEIRKLREEVEDIHEIWVVDENNVLVGNVGLTDLVLADGENKIESIMEKDFQYVHADLDQEEVAMIFRKYDLVALPVVNDRHQLLGQITIDDIIDVLDEEVSEDISKLAGANDEELQEDSFLKISSLRMPWLFVAFVGELISAVIISKYGATLEQLIAVSFFIPIIMAMGGSTGQQSSAIVIRGLATGEISYRNLKRRFFRELRVSLFIGLVFGTTLMLASGWWLQNFTFGLMIGLTLNFIILQAALFGGSIPFILKRLNVDPALASGPFISTFNDIMGLLIYLTLLTSTIPLILK